MKKKTIIVILIIVLNVITQDYTQDTAEIMQSKLEEIKVDLEAGKEIKDIEEKLKKIPLTVKNLKGMNIPLENRMKNFVYKVIKL